MDKNLETLAYRLKDMATLRNLFSVLNYDFDDKPVNKDGWSDEQKDIVVESRIIASKNDYLIYYIQTNTDSISKWKGIASRIIKDNHGLCMICSHNPSGFKWAFSSLSKEFSKSFSETRHVPIELKPNSGVPRTFVEFLEGIKVEHDQTALSIVNKVSDAFDSFAIQIHDELTINVFEALKILSEGIILNKANNLALNESTLEEIREPTFILLYRIMFILYAEDRSVFPNSQFYYDNFSLKWLKKEWILNTVKIETYAVQKRLSKLFRLIEVGSDELNYDRDEFFIRSYYGRLFDRKIHSKLEKWKIPNENLLKAIGLLTRTHDKKGNYFFLDYSALETRHLGAIYEHLLEFHLTAKNNKVADLPNPKERKSTGSYYTPKYIVDYIVENTVGPLIDNIVKNTPEPGDQIDKILDLNILDPAMGSGHFLVGAVTYIAKRICEIEYGQNEVTEQAFVERKRDVARRCIYGVDINPLAVDLAQVSLWLETLSSERPLSFLSAHLKVGNSLIGANISDILDKQTTLMESTAGRERFKKNVRDFIMLETLDDDTPDAVRTKTVKYDSMQSKGTIYSDLKLLLDAKVSKEFGVDVPPLGDFVSKIGEEVLDSRTKGRVWTETKKVVQEHSLFHWDLEFLDIFYDVNGRRKKNSGFDAVIGNPPYVRADVDDLKYQKQRLWMISSCKFISLYEKWDLYVAFLEQGLNLLKKNSGVLCFIVSNSFNTSKYANKIKSIINSKYTLKQIDFFKNVKLFKNVGVESVILLIQNSITTNPPIRILHTSNFKTIEVLPTVNIELVYKIDTYLNFDKYFNNCELLGNICYISKGMVLNSDEKTAKNLFKKDDLISKTMDKIHTKKYLEAECIGSYRIKKELFLEWGTKRCPAKISRKTFPELYLFPKLIRGRTTDAIFDNQSRVCNEGCMVIMLYYMLANIENKSINSGIKKWTNINRYDLEKISKKFNVKFLLSIINSNFSKFYLNTIRRHRLEYYFYPDDLRKLPIKKISFDQQKIFAKEVDKIINLNTILNNKQHNKKQKNILELEIQKLDLKINKMIYKLYAFEENDIKIIEKHF